MPVKQNLFIKYSKWRVFVYIYCMGVYFMEIIKVNATFPLLLSSPKHTIL